MNQKKIMPFHLFKENSQSYLLNIEKMQVSTVNEITAAALETMSAEPEKPLPFGLEEDLEKLGLIVKDNGLTKPVLKKEFSPIVSMALFVTQSCNLRCIYCYEENSGGSMEEKTAYQAVDWLLEQAGNVKKIYVYFFGGEPFLNFPLMKKVAAYAREKAGALDKAVCFGVTTNATLLDEETILFIRKYDVHVLVSMDGPKEIHDKQRPFAGGRGSYDVILPRVKKLLAAKPETRVHAVLVDDSQTGLIKNSLLDIGFSEVTLLPASPTRFEAGEGAGKAKQSRNLDGLLRELELEAELWLKLVRNRDSESLKDLRSKAHLFLALLALLHNKKKRYACGAGVKYIAVSCTGDIYLCHRFIGQEGYKLGNVFSNDLEREIYQESPLVRVPACVACFARYYCAGWCKHDNTTSCGSVWTPSEEICLLKRRELELAAALIGQFDEPDCAFLKEYKIFPPKPCPLDF